MQDEVEHWLQWSAQRPVEELIRRLYARTQAMGSEIATRIREAVSFEEAERVAQSSFRDSIQEHVRDLRELVVRSHPPASGDQGSKSSDPDG